MSTFQLSSEPLAPRRTRKTPAPTSAPKLDCCPKPTMHDRMCEIGEPATPNETSFRHGHWRERRDRIRAHMASSGASEFHLYRWDRCGANCFIEWSDTLQKHRTRADYCHNRHCEPCMRAKANRIAANLKTRVSRRADGRYRFITLTMQHSSTPLNEQIRRLYRCFKHLRRSPLWKRSQVGGAAILEVKRSVTGWHPHLHVISEGKWINVRELSRAWLEATGDSFIVDVRQLQDGDAAAHYVTKYVTKSTSPAVWHDRDAAQEWLSASKGVRTVLTFGTWRGFRLTQAVKQADDWQPVARLDQLVARARSGEEHALHLILAIRPPGDFDAHVPQ